MITYLAAFIAAHGKVCSDLSVVNLALTIASSLVVKIFLFTASRTSSFAVLRLNGCTKDARSSCSGLLPGFEDDEASVVQRCRVYALRVYDLSLGSQILMC